MLKNCHLGLFVLVKHYLVDQKMLTEYMPNPNGFTNNQLAPCRERMALPQKGSLQLFYCGPVHTEKQVDNMPRTGSTDVFSEEPPAWFKDLLNEPDSPVNKPHHRRSASDSSGYLAAPESSCRDKESWSRNTFGRPDGACNFQMPVHCRYGVPPGSFDRYYEFGSNIN